MAEIAKRIPQIVQTAALLEEAKAIMVRIMSVLVRFGNRKAFLAAGRWTSADAALEKSLNEATLRWFQESGGPPLRETDQEAAVARELAARFDGRVMTRLKAANQASNRAFLAQRQMQLDFQGPPLPVTRGGRRRAAKA